MPRLIGNQKEVVADLELEEMVTFKKKKVIKRIKLTEIQCNAENNYPIEDIEELAADLRKSGLLTPIGVYLNEESGRYVLFSGERRYTASMLNYTQYSGDEYIEAIEYSQPKTKDEEIRIIISFNSYRQKTKQIVLNEVKQLSEIYDRLPDEEKYILVKDADGSILNEVNPITGKVCGGERYKRRDWIGEIIGKTGRTVQEYLNMLNKNEVEVLPPSKIDSFLKNKKLIMSSAKKIQSLEFESMNLEEIKIVKECLIELSQAVQKKIELVEELPPQ